MAEQSHPKDEFRTALPNDNLVPLESILCTEELNRRPARPPDYEMENRALAALAQALANSPRTILQTLADKILEVFKADSAGISLLTREDGGKRFYWPAIAGVWKPHIGGGTPRDFGPCGDVLDRNTALLFRHFERRYTYFLPVTPPVEECLLVPFYVEGKAVGTIWAIAHDERRKFDAEDLRQLESLGRFASAAYQAVASLDVLEQRGEALGQSHTELAQGMAELQKMNTQAREARRAALNLMEDAVQSRQLVEALNLQLRSEVTERKHAEEEIKKLNRELEQRVTQRTEELQRANGALLQDMEKRKKLEEQLLQVQRMESIGTLAGGIAHDFNNILNIIQGHASLLGKHSTEKNQPAENLEAIGEAVQRGAGIVRQLLTLARKTETRLEPTDTNAIIIGLTKLLEEVFPKTLEMALDLSSDLPLVMADVSQVNQVILNLCVNARDAMPQGGKLSLKTEVVSGPELRHRFHEAQEERYIWIRVSDTGIGMDAETRHRIFEPFFTTKEHTRGTGLGLSVVYGVISNHSGFVDVRSEVGQGTTFDIYLPLPKNELELVEIKQQLDRQRKIRAGAGATLLFVDDEIQQLRLMQNFLESHGFKVLAARDGAEAVERHRRHKDEVAMVILDLQLPKMNGWEAFQIMRKIKPELKALFATGFAPAEIEDELSKGKIGGIIMKPYNLDELLEKISEALRHFVTAVPSDPSPSNALP